MQQAPCLPLNMSEEVSPYHWSPDRFLEFSGLNLDKEFDAVAPIFVYFHADSSRVVAAKAGAAVLKAAGHPLLDGMTVKELMETTRTPDGLAERYTALLWAIVDEVIPCCEAHIDPYGAYSFEVPGDPALLAGDDSGTFAYYESAKKLRQRLNASLSLAL